MSEHEEKLVGAVMQWQRQEQRAHIEEIPDTLGASGGNDGGIEAEATQQEGEGIAIAPPVFTTPSFKDKKVLCVWACMRVEVCVIAGWY
eukprot:SAG25_NODE_647_length_6214_cov_5.107277_8_plen_89_part_00